MRAKLQLKDKQLISEYVKSHDFGSDKENVDKIIREIEQVILKNKGKFRYMKHHPEGLLEAEQYRIFTFDILDENFRKK